MALIRVAVVDSGWDTTIIEPRISMGRSFVPPSKEVGSTPTSDLVGHGTACADLIMQANPSVEIVPVRVFGRTLETDPYTVVAALDWLSRQDVHVINMSFATFEPSTLRDLYVTCERLRRQNCILVAAAANSGRRWSLPATLEPVIGVTTDMSIPTLSLSFDRFRAIECATAPDFCARGLRGSIQSVSGTSYAAAHVSGVISRVKQDRVDADLEEIRRLMHEMHASDDRAQYDL